MFKKKNAALKNAALYTAAAVFALVSLAHWVRFFRADEVLIGGFSVPRSWSLAAGLMIPALAGWMLAAARR
ncbi:MAG: hypothetical protein IIC06_00245 [Proteobacteria bacterium]|nr:hypothetical protein [Pseudomonadota bacterium]